MLRNPSKSGKNPPKLLNPVAEGVNPDIPRLHSLSSASLELEGKIHTIRGTPVMLDRDLAELYQVKPIRLREQVRRNRDRFPDDFMFQLGENEVEIMVSQNAIPSRKHLGAPCLMMRVLLPLRSREANLPLAPDPPPTRRRSRRSPPKSRPFPEFPRLRNHPDDSAVGDRPGLISMPGLYAT